MHISRWCEHVDKISKYTLQEYFTDDEKVLLRIQSWFCPECGIHGASTEIINKSSTTANSDEKPAIHHRPKLITSSLCY